MCNAQQPTTLRLFEGAMLQPSVTNQPATKRRKTGNKCIFLYAGGPVWGLDWAPGMHAAEKALYPVTTVPGHSSGS